MQDSNQIPVVINVPRALKGAWVAASRMSGQKLTDWLLERIGPVDQDFNGFTLNVPAFLPFERYVLALSDSDARAAFQRVRGLDAQQADAVAAVKIARMYLEKRVAMADGQSDKELFHDINVDALGYFNAAPGLTHTDLIDVLSVAQGE